MDKTPTVFVTQETNHDFRSAESFGAVEFLTTQDLNNNKNSPHNDALIGDLWHKLLKYDPAHDFLITVGSPYVSAVVFMILGLRKIREIQLLRWDNRGMCYIPTYINIRHGKAGAALLS